MSSFKVGDRVYKHHPRGGIVEGTVKEITHNRGATLINIDRDDGVRGSGPYGLWSAPADGQTWKLKYRQGCQEPAVPKVVEWDYGEADRLHREAVTAVEKYNAYIERKPTKCYLPINTSNAVF